MADAARPGSCSSSWPSPRPWPLWLCSGLLALLAGCKPEEPTRERYTIMLSQPPAYLIRFDTWTGQTWKAVLPFQVWESVGGPAPAKLFFEPIVR